MIAEAAHSVEQTLLIISTADNNRAVAKERTDACSADRYTVFP